MAFEWVWFIFIGIAAGWLASLIVRGRGMGLLGNLMIGVIGALIGGLLLGRIIIPSGGWWTFLTATLGAIIFLLVVRLIKRA